MSHIQSIAFALILAMLSGPPPPPVVTVSAAISLTDALEEVGLAYRASGGGEVRFNFAGSNVLARQIVNGAPVDLFVSADDAQMAVVEEAGALAPGTRIDLLRNQLAVVLSSSAPAITTIQELAQLAIRRLAVGDPLAVPAGVYAKQYLQAINLWAALERRVIPLTNVRAALTAVETGSADAAIVYRSDVRAASRARLAFVVSGPGAPRIVYPAAVVKASKQPAETERFLAFLRGAPAAAIFARFGFEPMGGPVR
ncbi:MAG: molybdate ABC transporter substrate-binding protein [Vicinamibacterales bacterium]